MINFKLWCWSFTSVHTNCKHWSPDERNTANQVKDKSDYFIVSCWSHILFFPVVSSWRRHDMETLSAMLSLYNGNPSVYFPHKGPAMQSVDVFFAVSLNKMIKTCLRLPINTYFVQIGKIWIVSILQLMVTCLHWPLNDTIVYVTSKLNIQWSCYNSTKSCRTAYTGQLWLHQLSWYWISEIARSIYHWRKDGLLPSHINV